MHGYDCIDGTCKCRYCGAIKPCTEFRPAVTPRGHSLCCLDCNTAQRRIKLGNKPALPRVPPKPCLWCGTIFQTDHNRSKYCSRDCQNAKRRKPDVSKIYPKRCPHCESAFITRTSTVGFCSPGCRNRFRYQRTFVPVQPRPATCVDCGIEYTQKHGRNVRCPDCVRDRAAAMHSLHKARRRGLELNNGAYQPINRRRIYERDKWTCYLCHQPVSPNADNNDPRQPTLDHIWPLSLGGTHTEDNVRLACRQCNTRKGIDFLVPPPPSATKRRARTGGT